jgi:TolA-binding protein
MQQSRGATAPSPQPANDIVFACVHCATSFVVDAAAAGMAIQCQSCGKATRVPKQSTPAVEVTAANAARISDLQHQLKENASQRTEITGYINQLSIQLHRWQLRLKDLNERKGKLDAELNTLTGPSGA